MSQSNQLPIWLRQMNGWEDAPPWLLELITRFEQGPGFEGLDDVSGLGFDTGQAAAAVTPEGEDWLSRLESEVPVEESPSGPAPVPDWLSGLETDTGVEPEPAVPESGVPGWLSGTETEAPSPEAEPAEEAEIPDWLSGFETRLAAEQEREAGGEAEADWLSGLESEIPGPQAATGGDADRTGWLSTFESGAGVEDKEAPEPPSEPPVEKTGLPDWLSGLETEAPDWLSQAQAGEASTQDALPDWLAEFEQEVTPPPEQPKSEEAIPDWPARPEPEAPMFETTAGDAVPDWLSDMSATDEQGPDWLDRLQPETSEIKEPPVREAAPDWLTDLQREAPDVSETENAQAAAVPDWLSRFAPEEAALPEAEDPAQAAVPDWLTRLQAQAPDVPEAEDAQETSVPDWLSRFAPEEAAPSVDKGAAPNWLARLQPKEPEAPEIEGAQEAAVPDWLSEFAPEEAAPSADKDAAPDWLARLEPEAPEPETAAEASVPDWLAEPGAEDAAPWKMEETASDWLARLQPEEPESAADEIRAGPPSVADEEPSGGEPGVPDWLARMAAETERETEPGAPADQESTVPDWLAALEPISESETAEQDVGVPDWLAQMTADMPDRDLASQQVEDTVSEPEEGIPEWLAGMGTGRLAGQDASLAWLDEQMGPSAPESATEQPTPQEKEGVPGWLQDMGEVSTAAEAPPARGVTDWLHGIEEMPAPPQVPEVPAEGSVLPEWLQELEMTVPAPSAQETAAPDEPDEIPDWLREVPDRDIQEPEVVLPERDRAPQVELPTTPSWMQEMYTVSEEQVPVEDVLALPDREIADVPEWVRDLRQEQKEAPVPIAEGPEETSGPLAGLRGVLDPEPLLAILPKSTYRPVPPVPEAQLQQVAVVEQILSEPTARPLPAARATGRLIVSSLGRWVMYLLVLATLMVAPLRTWVRPPVVEPISDFQNTVNALAEGSEVLLVVDYDPSLDGEMTPLARAVIWHLLQRNVGIVTVSLTPQGPAMVQDLFDEYPPLLDGVYYLNLGYLPAHPASLQAFALDPLAGAAYPAPEVDVRQVPLGQRITALSDMDLVVLLSGDPSRVRWWIEQVSILGAVDMVAGVSAGAMPYVLPYYSADGNGQLKGLLGGLPAAAGYEDMIGAGFAPSSRENFIVTANLQLLLAAVVVLGAVMAAIKGRRRVSRPVEAQG